MERLAGAITFQQLRVRGRGLLVPFLERQRARFFRRAHGIGKSGGFRVEENIYEMVRSGMDAKKLDVHHVRQPRERMPLRVLPVQFSEGPSDPLTGQSFFDHRVFEDVSGSS
ncbi:MAG TPA: hypothetical protein VK850_19955 [Candidatus Binatia bacterium]|nr:hypothetical protein [Candidatus Binatia bacterium]